MRRAHLLSPNCHFISAYVAHGEPKRLVVAALQAFSEQRWRETTVAVIAGWTSQTKSTFHPPPEILTAGQETPGHRVLRRWPRSAGRP